MVSVCEREIKWDRERERTYCWSFVDLKGHHRECGRVRERE